MIFPENQLPNFGFWLREVISKDKLTQFV